MTHKIFCQKLKKEADGLAQAPIPGEMGERIHKNISAEAWGMWIAHQTMLINEYRLSMVDVKARAFLIKEMENFFFGEGSDKPPGYVIQN